jgi:cysteine-rich repeat protein
VDLACFWTGSNAPTTTTCGNGVKEEGEACDDGNQVDCDGCHGDCTLESCGDGNVCPPEECDEGAANSPTGTCTPMCKKPRCGDGFVQAKEECDDGNTKSGDGCDSKCKNECVAGTLVAPGGNPDNVKTFFDPKTLHCYARVDNPPKSWSGAENACTGWEGHLFAFSDSPEHDAVIAALAPKSTAWTGGNDMMSAGHWEWSNMAEGWPLTPPWAAGAPDADPMHRCVEIGSDGKLVNEDCAALHAFLCERKLPAASN